MPALAANTPRRAYAHPAENEGAGVPRPNNADTPEAAERRAKAPRPAVPVD
jgi:hypothetical protein